MAISKSFYEDVKSAGQQRINAAKPITVTRLTKAGKPSKIASDTKKFYTTTEAESYMNNLRNLNPGTTFEFNVVEAK